MGILGRLTYFLDREHLDDQGNQRYLSETSMNAIITEKMNLQYF